MKTITLDLTLVPFVLLCVIKCPFYPSPSAMLYFISPGCLGAAWYRKWWSGEWKG